MMAAMCAAATGPEQAAPSPAAILSTDLGGNDLVFFDSASRQTALIAGSLTRDGPGSCRHARGENAGAAAMCEGAIRYRH